MSTGGEAACYIIEKHLSRFIEGQVSLYIAVATSITTTCDATTCQEPCNIELMWDQMYRATLHYGRKGLTLLVIALYVAIAIAIIIS